MTRSGLRASRAALVVLASAALAAGCAAMPDERRATFGIDFRLPEGAARTGAVVFILDGVNRDVFHDLLEAGRLPNFRRYLVDRGLYVERAVANLPCVTLANQASLMTGLFSGRHGIPGNNWFDRVQLLWRNYESYDDKNKVDGDLQGPTVFERLGDATTFSLFHQVHRGATKWTENWTSAGPPYFFGWYGLVDRITLWRFDVVADVARRRRAWPALVVAYQLAPDMEAYRAGVSSENYRWALEHADAHAGRILRDIEAAGRLDDLVLALVSDHGMMDVTRRWPAGPYLRDTLRLAVDLKEEAENLTFERRLDRYEKFAAVTTRGDRYWALYLRKPRPTWADPRRPEFEPWPVRPSAEDLAAYPTRDGRRVDLVAELLKADAVEAVAFRALGGRVRLAMRGGTVDFWREGPGRGYAARAAEGADPLGYAAAPAADLLDGRPHPAAEWLAATAGTEYPDLAPQLVTYFESLRAADVAVFAAPGWNFGFPNQAGHGGLRAAEMTVPMILAGPGVPHERRPGPVRTVDLVPTLLHLLGRPVPADLDGRNLLAP